MVFCLSCSWLPKVTVIDDPLDKQEHLTLGLAYEKDGQLELAEREYKLARPLAQANYALGNLNFQKGKSAEARKFYQEALRVDKLPAASNNLAWLILTEGGDLNQARQLALQAVEEGQKRGEDEARLDSYRSTLRQIERALKGAKVPLSAI
jgi:tetratricopeptide (TPR) repeat protein